MKLNNKQSLIAVAVVAGFAAQSALAEDVSGATTWPPLAAGAAAVVGMGEFCGYGQTVTVNTKTSTISGQKSATVAARKAAGASELRADDVPQVAWTETIELVPVSALAETQAAPEIPRVAEAPAPAKKAVAASSGTPKAKLAGKSPAKPVQSGSYAYGGTGNCVTDMLVAGGMVYSSVFQVPTASKVSAKPETSKTKPASRTVAWSATR
jgi:hypothetical protein